METKEFQEKCVRIVKNIDDKYNLNRTPELSFIQLTEEIGELAKEVNRPTLRRQTIDPKELNGEFADIMLQLAVLANMYNIDLEGAVDYKLKELQNRHGVNIIS